MKKLELIPFSKKENEVRHSLNEFTELDKPFAVLVHNDTDEVSSTNNYRFGVKTNDGEFYWFFNGEATTTDRFLALECYQQLKVYCEANAIGTPSAYREYEKRE